MKKNIKTTRGFTLIEVIVSLAIFAIVMIIFSTMMMTSLNIHRDTLELTQYTQAIIEDIETEVNLKNVESKITLVFPQFSIGIKCNEYVDENSRLRYLKAIAVE